MITPTGGRADTLTVDFDMMRAVAAATDGRNEELRTLLAGFIADAFGFGWAFFLTGATLLLSIIPWYRVGRPSAPGAAAST